MKYSILRISLDEIVVIFAIKASPFECPLCNEFPIQLDIAYISEMNYLLLRTNEMAKVVFSILPFPFVVPSDQRTRRSDVSGTFIISSRHINNAEPQGRSWYFLMFVWGSHNSFRSVVFFSWSERTSGVFDRKYCPVWMASVIRH